MNWLKHKIGTTDWLNIVGKLLNISLGLGFFYAGYKIVANPQILNLGTDKTSAATLAGALFGAGAIFLGNQITQWFKETSFRQKQKNIRSLLTAEIVSMFIQHAQQARLLKIYMGARTGNETYGDTFDRNLTVPVPTVFNGLLTEITCLTNKELEAIVNLYDNLGKTRTIVENCKLIPNIPLTLLLATTLHNHFQNDCENAADVINLIAPNRKIQLPNNKTILLTSILKNPSLLN